MNFLAHFYLSGDDEELLIGNFIADAVKGRKYEDYSKGVRRGILLHRSIDHFTDTHPVVMESKLRLRPAFRHYSPVIIDVFYDHFLAADWSQYHGMPLVEYATGIYGKLERAAEILPVKSKQMLPYMVKHDWLNTYARLDGIQRVLTGMSNRTPFESGMQYAAEALRKHYPAFRNEFEQFFPELEKHVLNFLQNNHK